MQLSAPATDIAGGSSSNSRVLHLQQGLPGLAASDDNCMVLEAPVAPEETAEPSSGTLQLGGAALQNTRQPGPADSLKQSSGHMSAEVQATGQMAQAAVADLLSVLQLTSTDQDCVSPQAYCLVADEPVGDLSTDDADPENQKLELVIQNQMAAGQGHATMPQASTALLSHQQAAVGCQQNCGGSPSPAAELQRPAASDTLNLEFTASPGATSQASRSWDDVSLQAATAIGSSSLAPDSAHSTMGSDLMQRLLDSIAAIQQGDGSEMSEDWNFEDDPLFNVSLPAALLQWVSWYMGVIQCLVHAGCKRS